MMGTGLVIGILAAPFISTVLLAIQRGGRALNRTVRNRKAN